MREITACILAGRPLALFLDFDGTLVPIRPTPGGARLSERRREILRRLSQRVLVAIVSGRSLADVKARVRLGSLAILGNHGLEIQYGQRPWSLPGARAVAGKMRRALAAINRRLKSVSGLIVEDKVLTGSVHYRRVNPALWPNIESVVREEVGRRRSVLRMTTGHRVYEVRPRVVWDKGRGVCHLLSRFEAGRRPLVVYIGDDQTDEDAFRALGRDAITIRVGPAQATRARYRLRTVREVWALIRRLERLASTLGPPDDGPGSGKWFPPPGVPV